MPCCVSRLMWCYPYELQETKIISIFLGFDTFFGFFDDFSFYTVYDTRVGRTQCGLFVIQLIISLSRLGLADMLLGIVSASPSRSSADVFCVCGVSFYCAKKNTYQVLCEAMSRMDGLQASW